MSELVGPEARRLFEEVLQQQEAKGLEKYGHPLSTHNGRDALLDAMQEAVDLWQYLAQLRMERQGSVVLGQMQAKLAASALEAYGENLELQNNPRAQEYYDVADAIYGQARMADWEQQP